ncbi:hypothetical protein T07_10832 [Trichinella nelsoni]|uniref:Uncharacterized protein n=1 Tax=Trichinella nelsoni TaxID=6336 RepID=A0A0V0SGI9_9BILA|nr:hypothetical protein T07_10832 [Trichinella nelsoni]
MKYSSPNSYYRKVIFEKITHDTTNFLMLAGKIMIMADEYDVGMMHKKQFIFIDYMNIQLMILSTEKN